MATELEASADFCEGDGKAFPCSRQVRLSLKCFLELLNKTTDSNELTLFTMVCTIFSGHLTSALTDPA
eukprot:1185939-Prorocentrum_minimum.AAC.3